MVNGIHHRLKHKKWLHKAVYVAGILGPLMTIPQIIKIWLYQDASGVSALSWGSYFVLSGFWLAYGIEERETPIIINYVFWMVMHLVVVTGVLIYG